MRWIDTPSSSGTARSSAIPASLLITLRSIRLSRSDSAPINSAVSEPNTSARLTTNRTATSRWLSAA